MRWLHSGHRSVNESEDKCLDFPLPLRWEPIFCKTTEVEYVNTQMEDDRWLKACSHHHWGSTTITMFACICKKLQTAECILMEFNNEEFYKSLLNHFSFWKSKLYQSNTTLLYLHCCTVHFVDSLNITQPTNALIVYHLF
jgi:hypothetical protein